MLALANGVRQSVTLEATNFKHYSVTVPDGSLPLELSLTKLNGEAALYVSPTGLGPHSRPRPRAARMSHTARMTSRCPHRDASASARGRDVARQHQQDVGPRAQRR